MTKTKTDKSKHQETRQGSKPDLIAYTVEARGDDKSSIWTQVGAAWAHKDEKGFDVRCKAFPIDGRLTLRFQDQTTESNKPNGEPEGPGPANS